jgi:hypothetical protein
MFKNMPEGTRKDMLAESIQLCHHLASKGEYIHASPLQPEATGSIVRVRDGKPMVTDGPFMETKEQLAGYFLIDARIEKKPSESPNECRGRASARSKSDRWSGFPDCLEANSAED